MSNALAIAAVTAVLKDLLNNGLIAHDLASVVGMVNVTAKPPDLITTGPSEPAQLNLFMYHATENQGWRNVGQPARDDRGERLSNPPLALNLHYLLMAYGGADFQAEILMGYAMQLLHETPILSRSAVRTALAPIPPVTGSELPTAYNALSAADLADQIELIKITPESLSTEDLAKLWTAFQAKFRLTAAYQASVVLIQSTRSTRSSLPVNKHKVYALPLSPAVIEQVSSGAPANADPRITVASTLVLEGWGLRGPVTLVRIGDLELPPPALSVSDTRISFPLASLTSLRAGVQAVQVIHQIPMGEPEVAHRGFESNVAAFVLHPTIDPPSLSSISSQTVNGQVLTSANLTVSFKPDVGKAQRVMVFLNEYDASDTPPARAYSFIAPKDNGITNPAQMDTSSITFAVSGLLAGDYLVRVQVDGAENLLGRDVGGKYNAPKITIP